MNSDLNEVATLIETGELDEAAKRLDQAAITDEDRAEELYLKALLAEKAHEFEKAVDLYEESLEIDCSHATAKFRLAYLLDLRGDAERAIELYEECTRETPAPVNALINLAVLYEDDGEYAGAEACLERVLAEYPNHARARLFLRDIQSAQDMYYDEEMERARKEHNAVLDTPVSDFELSVRSRNCLKQMNIHTLGDLLKITEPELLAYKNFGETSLNEIKLMLKQKRLRLGQLLEEPQGELLKLPKPAASTGDPDTLSRSVTELELSARSRKCLQRLGITTLGELASRSEQELLSIKNFGQTSLNEIKRRMSELGLALRTASK
ncbi:MAG: tetratricopeptide repeat protein [Phycisphaerales bacterium]|nr:MAG: tetratricopeptide repeat protein [Phycisphaerales bacterium]